MSEIQFVKGTLKPSNLSIKGLINKISKKISYAEEAPIRAEGEGDQEFKSRQMDYIYEWFRELDDVTIINDVIYDIVKIKYLDPYDAFLDLKTDSSGEVSFTAKYYDGGTSWEELVENKLKEGSPSFSDSL